MRCSSCNRLIVLGGVQTGEGIFCSIPCFKNYRQSRQRLAQRDLEEAPVRPIFTWKEGVIYGLLLGICGNVALNDLARRTVPEEEPGQVTSAAQMLKHRAMDQVRGYDALSDRLLTHFGGRGRQGHHLGNFYWSATPLGDGLYRVRLTYTEDGSYRVFSWKSDLGEGTVTAEDITTRAVAGL